MHVAGKIAIAAGVAYAGLVLYRMHGGVAFEWALLHPFTPIPDVHGTSDLPVQRAVVIDLFKAAPARTKALTNAFRR